MWLRKDKEAWGRKRVSGAPCPHVLPALPGATTTTASTMAVRTSVSYKLLGV